MGDPPQRIAQITIVYLLFVVVGFMYCCYAQYDASYLANTNTDNNHNLAFIVTSIGKA